MQELRKAHDSLSNGLAVQERIAVPTSHLKCLIEGRSLEHTLYTLGGNALSKR